MPCMVRAEMSLHLTIAFEGFDGLTYDALSHEQKLAVLKPRVGNALPFVIDPEKLSLADVPLRGYYNFLPLFTIERDFIRLHTPKRIFKLKPLCLDILRLLQWRCASTFPELAQRLDVDPDRVGHSYNLVLPEA